MNIIAIRHAQPHDEADTGGHGDPALSDLGLRQAEAIADYLCAEHIDHIVASPLLRAHQTALPLAERLGIEPELDDDLKEAGWQAGAYLRSEENLDHFIEQIRADPDFLYRPEGRDVFGERVMRSFTRIARSHPGKTVAVFCHGMVKATLIGSIVGVEPGPDQFQPHYTGLTRVQASSTRDLWSLRSFNETMHLRGF